MTQPTDRAEDAEGTALLDAAMFAYAHGWNLARPTRRVGAFPSYGTVAGGDGMCGASVRAGVIRNEGVW